MEDFLRSLRTRDGTASTFLMCTVLCLGGGTDGGLSEVLEDKGRYSLNLSYVSSPLFRWWDRWRTS
jgi:hypothetical protein